MKTRTLPFCIGLTITTVISSLPAKAASFNFDDLQLIPVRPIDSDNFLSFNGEPEDNQGQTAFLNPDPTAPDFGHREISKNSPPDQFAPYYTVGRQSSPEQSGATRATSLNGGMGFMNFFNYINTNSIDLSRIGFGYGQKSDRAFTETWNLRDDLLGQDWLASPDSTIEERIYQANPNSVESFLVLDDMQFITFDYTPLYVVLDKGETVAFQDDAEIVLTEAVKAQKVSGLDPLLNGLAESFVQDVKLQGGKVQIVSEDSGVSEPVPAIDPSTNFALFNLRLPLSIRAVQVPEPSAIGGLFLVGTLATLFNKRRQN